MKTILTTLAVISVMLGTVAARASQDPVQRRAIPEAVLTGCVVQGSSSTLFILDNAKKDPNSAVEKGERYLLSSSVKDVDLRTHLNHEVRITGEVDLRVSAIPSREPVSSDPKRPANERTLPRLIARTITLVSDKCPAGKIGL